MEELAYKDLAIIAGVIIVIIGAIYYRKNKNVKGSTPRPSIPREPRPPKKKK